MTIEEILEELSDEDLEFSIKEIYELENKEDGKVSDTIMLFEIYSKLDEVEAFHDEMKYTQLTIVCFKEYSFRKAGLK